MDKAIRIIYVTFLIVITLFIGYIAGYLFIKGEIPVKYTIEMEEDNG